MTKDEALKLALEALELAKDNLRDHGDNCFLHDEGEYNRCFCGKDSLSDHLQSVVEKLDEALAQPEPWEKFCDSNCVWTDHHHDCKLAQPEQEPVAWMHVQGDYKEPSFRQLDDFEIKRGWEQYPLYTTPPQRTWVELTDEEIKDCFKITPDQHLPWHIYQRIEAKLKEKNT